MNTFVGVSEFGANGPSNVLGPGQHGGMQWKPLLVCPATYYPLLTGPLLLNGASNTRTSSSQLANQIAAYNLSLRSRSPYPRFQYRIEGPTGRAVDAAHAA